MMVATPSLLEDMLRKIVLDPCLHAKWLNTLSFMENCGARKIALCEHPIKVKEEMLKHAAEEFRHAYYLKQQIPKISADPLSTYSFHQLLGGFKSWHYLNALDLLICRYLKEEEGVSGPELKKIAYLLVTYAIELRASELYPLYHAILKECGSKISVKSIVLEEEEHLNEMDREISLLPKGDLYRQKASHFELGLFNQWLAILRKVVA